MGSKVPPMTPRRLGRPTTSDSTGGPTPIGGSGALPGGKFAHPRAEAINVLGVVVRARFHEPLLGFGNHLGERVPFLEHAVAGRPALDRKSTRLNSSHGSISYAVFCL